MNSLLIKTIIFFLLPISAQGETAKIAKVLPSKRVVAQSSEEVILTEEVNEVVTADDSDAEVVAEDEAKGPDKANDDFETKAIETTTTTVTKKVLKPKKKPKKRVAPVIAREGNNVTVVPAQQPTPVHYGGDVYNFYFQKAPGPQAVMQGTGAQPAPNVQMAEVQNEELDEAVEEESDDDGEAEDEEKFKGTTTRTQFINARYNRKKWLRLYAGRNPANVSGGSRFHVGLGDLVDLDLVLKLQ